MEILLCGALGAFLNRWGGGGFKFLGINSGLLSDGFKAARRIIIPLLLWAKTWSWVTFPGAVLIGVVYSFNLNEIEPGHHVPARRDWEEIFLNRFAIAAALKLMGFGWQVFLIPAVWMGLVYLSNVGVKGWKLGWHWAELIDGFTVGATVA